MHARGRIHAARARQRPAVTVSSEAIAVSRTTLVTPHSWFEVPRLTSGALETGRLTLTGTGGDAPLADVRFDELLAVHRTFGAWRDAAEEPAASPEAVRGRYDELLAESRAVVARRAHAVLAGAANGTRPAAATLTFPDLAHPLLADSPSALVFLRCFLALAHAPSLVSWTRSLATAPEAAETGRTRAWVRLLLQKLAVDEDDADAKACLVALYATPGDVAALLADEQAAIDASGLATLASLRATLGLARPARVDTWWSASPRRHAEPGSHADVTVLVPAYRHEAFIESTLDSVLSQTYPNFRVAVVDDRSPDDTARRAAGVKDPRVSVTVNEANLGLGDSVLRALDRIDTPYVALLNSDDLFADRRLERCRAHLEASPSAQVVATGVVPIDGDNRPLTVDTVRPLFDGRRITDWLRWYADRGTVARDADLLAELLERNFLVTSSNIVARTSFLRACTPQLQGLQFCLDWQVFLSAAAIGGLVYDPAPLLGYRLHPSNTVWFDEHREVSYRLEANRVLVAALDAVRPEAPADAASTARFLARLSRHAARHSDARGLAMVAVDKLTGEGLERARSASSDVHDAVRTIVVDDASPVRVSPPATDETRAMALQALVDLAHEEADVVRRQGAVSESAAVARQSEAAEHRAATARLDDERQAAVDRAVRLQQALDEAVMAAAQAATDAEQRAAATAAAHAADISRLKGAPEWQLGDRLWNRFALKRLGDPALRARRRVRDLRNRASLGVRGLARRAGLVRPGAVVTACWSFPIHSQTFVYQEMTALAWTGLDCHVFCCDTNPRSELPGAFSGLWNQRLVMQTDWRRGQRDLAHFRRTRPDRVARLLDRLATATGLTPDALLGESIVLTGFTFARHVELAGARYLHTYFFYDQSFIGLMAAYLLEIPRGITAYADHMMGDYTFKLVPLHLELADIVVATSARIKQELGEIGGGRFDDKIIVKPNGIDVARFPYIPAADRLALEGVPELIAVNRIEPKKGLIYLVDAMGLLRDRGVAARLNIVGGVDTNTPTSAACQRELVARIDALGLGDAVVLHGVKQQHEFAPIAARSRAFVAPYVEVGSGDKDGIPTAVLEAMSTGLPIVATDAGSIAEASRDGREALIVPQRDAGALADAIAHLLTDRASYIRMSDAARERAVTEFDIHVSEPRLHERIRQQLARV